MNKTLIYAVIAVLVVGGIYYFAFGPSSSPAVKTEEASGITQTTATLRGEVDPNGSQTSFWYEFGNTKAMSTKTAVQLLGAGHTALSASVVLDGLDPNGTYYFRIAAQNEQGISYGVMSSFTTLRATSATGPAPKAGIPPAAQANSATLVTTNSATINGTINPKGSSVTYWFEYGSTYSLGNVTLVEAAAGGTLDIPVGVALSNLTPNTTYYYRLNAQNAWGTTNSSILNFTTIPTTAPAPAAGKAPTAETDLAAFVTRTGATLRGYVNPLGTAATYWFEYGNAKLPGAFALNQKTAAKSAGSGIKNDVVTDPISKLEPGATYYYRVVSENKYGKTFGAILNFKTQP